MSPDMPKPRPPHLHKETRHGRTDWYVRVNRGKRIRIRGVFGSAEFMSAYKAAVAGETVAQPITRKNTVRWLWERYTESDAWNKEIGKATRRQRLNIMRHVLAMAGDDGWDELDLEASRDRRTSSQGRNFLDAMRGMYRWAKKAALIEFDPSNGIKNPERTETKGFPEWDETDVARYHAKWPLGTKERVWLDVLLHTGPSRGDAVRLGKQHIKMIRHPRTKQLVKALTFRTEKGGEMIEVSVPMLPTLQRTLEAGPCGDLAFIVGKRGRPLTKESFGNKFSEAARAAGVEKSAHGVRKIAATRAAEAGCTTHELMALFGWLTVAMAERYTRSASRKVLALGASEKLREVENSDLYSRNGEVLRESNLITE